MKTKAPGKILTNGEYTQRHTVRGNDAKPALLPAYKDGGSSGKRKRGVKSVISARAGLDRDVRLLATDIMDIV